MLSVFAMKKGWKTGSGTPAEMHAAKVIMKDYTTGKLLHCQLRPDFDPEKHTRCQQSGFNLDLNSMIEPSASNYEEIKVEAIINPSQSSQDEEEKTSMIDTTITTMTENESATPSAAPALSAASIVEAEEDFDQQFFGRKVPKVKLNKGEKRQLKYAMKAGVNLNEIGDLKTFLNQQIKTSKQTHNTAKSAAGQKHVGSKVVPKTNTYKGLEGYVSD